MKSLHIFGGGTVAHIANHFAVCAPAYGQTAYTLSHFARNRFAVDDMLIVTHLTKMAGGDEIETNEDIANKIEELKKDMNTKIIFFNCALVDYQPTELLLTNDDGDDDVIIDKFGKHNNRINTREYPELNLWLGSSDKIISNIRKERKDIFLVGFKTTCGASKQEMYEKGLRLCKEGSVNLVLVNDTKTRWNMIITPEEAAYHETDNREDVLKNLIDMTWHRSQLTFTQSTVIAGNPVAWDDERVPKSLRTVVDYCIAKNAYKPFKDATVGHFAVKLSDTEFLTSIRKSNFNDLNKNGLVYVKTDGPDTVIAYGAKPSVGGQSQRTVFNDHPGMDCIVHFHCPLKRTLSSIKALPGGIPIRSQREVECGSHQCGKNTSDGLKQFGNLKAVYLDQHGPNIIFNRNIDPMEVIAFIESNFDLASKTGGYNI